MNHVNMGLKLFLVRCFDGALSAFPVSTITEITELTKSYESSVNDEDEDFVERRINEGCRTVVETAERVYYMKEKFSSVWLRYAELTMTDALLTLDAEMHRIDQGSDA